MKTQEEAVSIKNPARDQDEELKEYNRIYKEWDSLYHSMAVSMGLSDSAFIVLYSLCEAEEGCSQTEICSLVSMSKQTVNSCIAKLEKQGYVHMEKGKGRTLFVQLTSKGLDLVQKKIYPVIQMENRVFKKLEKQERLELLRLSRKYVDIFAQETRRFLDSEEFL